MPSPLPVHCLCMQDLHSQQTKLARWPQAIRLGSSPNHFARLCCATTLAPGLVVSRFTLFQEKQCRPSKTTQGPAQT